MPNNFLTLQNIARLSLLRLMQNLVMPNLCYRDFSTAFSDKGDTIQVKKPVVLTANKFTDGTPVERQDMKEGTVPVKLSEIATVDVKWGALEGAVNLTEEKLVDVFIDPAAAALAEKINSDGMLLYRKIPTLLGTPGTTPSALSDFSAIRKQFNKAKAPLSGRCAVWDPEADAKFTEISGLTKVSDAGTPETLREGEIGRLYGLDNYMSQAVATHTVGTAISGNKTIAVAAAASAGATSISVDSSAAAGTLKAGDIIAIGGHNYNVAEDVASISATAATVKLVQPLVEDVANDAAITFPAYVSGKTGYTANLAFHKNAFAFVTRPLMLPKGCEAYVATDEYNGLSVRVVRDYDSDKKEEVMSMDVLYGFECVYPELACVYAG